MNKYFSPSILLRIITALLLIGALAKCPYGYYTFLRLFTCGTGIYCAYLAKKHSSDKWLLIFAFVAILFNPFLPIKLGRSLWTILDIVTAIFMLISSYFFHENKKT
jgi:hypothetical protein